MSKVVLQWNDAQYCVATGGGRRTSNRRSGGSLLRRLSMIIKRYL